MKKFYVIVSKECSLYHSENDDNNKYKFDSLKEAESVAMELVSKYNKALYIAETIELAKPVSNPTVEIIKLTNEH